MAPLDHDCYRSSEGLPADPDGSVLPHPKPSGPSGHQGPGGITAAQRGFDGVSDGIRSHDIQDHNKVGMTTKDVETPVLQGFLAVRRAS